MTHTLKLLSFLLSLTLLGCNMDQLNQKKKITLQITAKPIDGSNIDGHYQAKFITLNQGINGTIPGSANFYRFKNKLISYVRFFGGGMNARHIQNVYTGNRCPRIEDDTNSDGIIDIKEAEKVLGNIFIPLDGDLSNQLSGNKRFPYGDLGGSYTYERIVLFSEFLDDLNREDQNLEDDIVKISKKFGFDFEGLTVLILGVEENKEIPGTVSTKGSLATYETLPVVCGIFTKVLNPPGEDYNEDDIPGPIEDSGEENNTNP